ncbi:hypothetical protein F5Y16DRAFT_387391 [Xylariaceae sp. FL0255]|nr:hypothetical protein F5Y16DRAFT_387391 [Xylariaceae sp. FL0255]
MNGIDTLSLTASEAEATHAFDKTFTLITICRDHHQLSRGFVKYVLKMFQDPCFPDNAKVDFHDELMSNERAPRHGRIVPLLTVFKFRDGYHLVFPYATEGSLKISGANMMQLRKTTIRCGTHADGLCLGIAKALAAIHQPCPIGSTADTGKKA